MTALPDSLRASIVQRRFDPLDCPYTPIHPEWEHFPIVRAIRCAEAESGLSYDLPRPVTP